MQTLYNIVQVANQVLELTPIDEIVLSEDFLADVDAVAAIISEAQGLSYDLNALRQQITRLFTLETAPSSSTELQIRLAEIRQIQQQVWKYALEAQTLINTLQRTVRHIQRLSKLIEKYIGNMSGNQNMTQVDAKTSQLLSELNTQMITYQRAQATDRITETVIIESVTRIRHEQLKSW